MTDTAAPAPAPAPAPAVVAPAPAPDLSLGVSAGLGLSVASVAGVIGYAYPAMPGNVQMTLAALALVAGHALQKIGAALYKRYLA